MKSPESPYFSPPALPATDHPLSMKGRFGRLSFIAWSAFLYFIFYLAVSHWVSVLIL